MAATYASLFFFRYLTDPDEGRYAEIPREMLQRGDWLKMTMLGYPYYEKPPLSDWFVASSFKIFGVHDWSARIPLCVGLLVLLGCVWKFLPSHWSFHERLMTFFTLATTLAFVGGITFLTTDAFLLVFFTLTCMSLYQSFRSENAARRNVYFFAAALSAASGILTKGIIAILLPGVIIGLWLLFERRRKDLLHPGFWAAGLFSLILVTPVLLLLEGHNPGFLHQFIFEEHIARFLGTRAKQAHPEPFWFFLPALPLILLPWSFFIPRLIRNALRNHLWRDASLFRFLVIWGSVVLIFFSMSSGKLISYILPAVPPCAILIGRWGIAEAPSGLRDRRLFKMGWIGPILLASLMTATWVAGVANWLPKEIGPVSAGVLLIPFLPLSLFLCEKLLHKPKAGQFIYWTPCIAGVLLATALLFTPLSGPNSRANRSPLLFQDLAAHLKAEDQLLAAWAYRPSLAFYTQRIYHPFEHEGELSYGMKTSPGMLNEIHSLKELNALIDETPGRVILFIPARRAYRFSKLPYRTQGIGVPSNTAGKVVQILRPNS